MQLPCHRHFERKLKGLDKISGFRIFSCEKLMNREKFWVCDLHMKKYIRRKIKAVNRYKIENFSKKKKFNDIPAKKVFVLLYNYTTDINRNYW